MSSWEWRVFFHDEVKKALDHLYIEAPLLYKRGFRNQSYPDFKIFSEASPILSYFSAEHQSVFFQEIFH